MDENNHVEAVVGIFILNPQREILLLKSHKWQNQYVVPGGHIEFGEKVEDAVKREAKEETGLDVFEPKFLCLYQYINDGEYYKENKHMLFLEYLVKTKNHSVSLNDESEDYVWVKLKDSLKLPLYHYTRKAIEDYLLI
jgi:nucleoside triphosphatase